MKMSKKTRALGRNKRHLRVRKRLSGTQERPRYFILSKKYLFTID